MQKRAIISLTDKTGVVPFAKTLAECGWEIVSTGGTAKVLRDGGLEVTDISAVTGFPECLGGRVKTLDPHVFAGILAMRDDPAHMARIAELNVQPVDMVVVNLYPFRQTIGKPGVTLEEAIENIDIGGPSMLRAAAKNWRDVTVVVDPADYGAVAEHVRSGGVPRDMNLRLALKVFETTAAYDTLISQYLRGVVDK